MSETYKVDCECTNCDHKGQVELPKGTPVSESMECPNCGCQTARKASAYVYVPPMTYPGMVFPSLPYSEPWINPQPMNPQITWASDHTRDAMLSTFN